MHPHLAAPGTFMNEGFQLPNHSTYTKLCLRNGDVVCEFVLMAVMVVFVIARPKA